MEWPKFRNLLEIQKFKITAQTVAIVVLSLVVVVQEFRLYSQARQKRTVIIPSVINAALEVSDIDASPKFLWTNILYSMGLLYTYTPETAADRFQEFLISFVDSNKIEELRGMLSDRLKSIQAVKISESFEGENVVFLNRASALVKGRVYRYSLGYRISVDALYLKVGYRLLDGNLRINSIVTITLSEYQRLQRQKQIEGKKAEEDEKQRLRSVESQKRKDELEQERLDRATGYVPDDIGADAYDDGYVPDGSLSAPSLPEEKSE